MHGPGIKMSQVTSLVTLVTTLVLALACAGKDSGASASRGVFAGRAKQSWSDPSRFIFAGVPWGSTPKYVRQAFARFRLVEKPESEANRLFFSGTVVGYKADIMAEMDEQGLASASVSFHAPPDERLGIYLDLADSLKAKYGPPSAVINNFGEHYGLWNASAAISAGKADLRTIWMQFAPDSSPAGGVALQITPEISIPKDLATSAGITNPKAESLLLLMYFSQRRMKEGIQGQAKEESIF